MKKKRRYVTTEDIEAFLGDSTIPESRKVKYLYNFDKWITESKKVLIFARKKQRETDLYGKFMSPQLIKFMWKRGLFTSFE